jgi:uncharacterized membrane protein YfcA
MRSADLTIPELALIAGTRGMLGAGIGLLVADRMSEEQRRAVGLTLLLVGAITTVPLLLEVFGKSKQTQTREPGKAADDRIFASDIRERTFEPAEALA